MEFSGNTTSLKVEGLCNETSWYSLQSRNPIAVRLPHSPVLIGPRVALTYMSPDMEQDDSHRA